MPTGNKGKVRILRSQHKSRVAQATKCVCKFNKLNYPPYSPDLALSNYCLCRNLTFHLLGTRFQEDNGLKAATLS